MKYSLKSIFGFAFLVAFALVFTSCEKENVDKVLEEAGGNTPVNNILTATPTTIAPVKPGNNTATIAYQGNTTVIDAYASYCNQNNKEFLTVTNNQALLSTTSVFSINSNDLNDNDFIIIYALDTVSGPQNAIIWSSVDTTQGTTAIELLVGASSTINFSVDPVLNEVKGNMSGTFMAGIIGGNPVSSPFTVSFDADIIQPHTFCN